MSEWSDDYYQKKSSLKDLHNNLKHVLMCVEVIQRHVDFIEKVTGIDPDAARGGRDVPVEEGDAPPVWCRPTKQDAEREELKQERKKAAKRLVNAAVQYSADASPGSYTLLMNLVKAYGLENTAYRNSQKCKP